MLNQKHRRKARLTMKAALLCCLSLALAWGSSSVAKISELADGGALQAGDAFVAVRGTGSATSVVQPHIVVYMWKRTA